MTAEETRQSDSPTSVKPGGGKRSLMQTHPRRLDVPILLALSAGLLIAGLTLPVMRTEKLIFWEDSYSIWRGILALLDEGYWFLSLILFLISMIFPVAKLILLAAACFARYTPQRRVKLMRWLEIAGRWSMLDVFVVAVIIVTTQLEGVISASPRVGLYLFAAAVLLSMITTMMVEKLASRANAAAA